jgi:hypothetical protein
MERRCAGLGPPLCGLDRVAVRLSRAALAPDELDYLSVLHVDCRDHRKCRKHTCWSATDP